MRRADNGRKLSKADAERLIDSVDTDGFVAVLSSCLATVLGEPTSSVENPGGSQFEPTQRWVALITRAASVGRWSQERVSSLSALEVTSLYELAAELNERRTLG
jgi:hypothetical protein